MSLVDSHIEIVSRYTWLDQQCENVYRYFTEGAVFVGVNAVQVAQAWWQDIETDLRACAPDDISVCHFTSVICRKLVDGGELGEYAIALDQQTGTRDPEGIGGPLPGTLAVGIRLTVGNTTTRPGQKRYPFLYDADVIANDVNPGILAAFEVLGAHIDTPVTLGEPVATGVLQPVVGGTIVDGYPTIYQDTLGHIVNPYVTSQVSRKRGHGS